jgi:hypothetical protein
MSKHIQLSVADPCHENWDSMNTAEKGRFCGSCQKQVIDFTNMSDSQLAAFFKKPSTGVCGRFYEDQLDRSIEIPKKRIPWVKYFFQFALPAFLFSLKASSQGTLRMGKPAVALEKKKEHKDSIPASALFVPPATPTIKQNDLVSQSAKVEDKTSSVYNPQPGNCRIVVGGAASFRNRISRADKRKLLQILEARKDQVSIKGKVIDSKNNPVPFATVVIKGATTGLAADSSGRFELRIQLEPQSKLEVSSVGFNTAEAMINMKTDLAKELIIQLTPNINLPEVVIYNSVVRRTIVGASTSVMGLTCRKEAKEETVLSQVKLYPNPIQRSSSFNIEIENPQDEKMQLSIVNMSDIIVSMKTENILKGSNRITVNTEVTWPAGIYIVQLSDEKGQVLKKEKLIVQ